MPRIAYANGRYVAREDASVHVEDSGYQLPTVPQVCEVARGRIIDMTGHLNRLGRSLRELSISWPVRRAALEVIVGEVS